VRLNWNIAGLGSVSRKSSVRACACDAGCLCLLSLSSFYGMLVRTDRHEHCQLFGAQYHVLTDCTRAQTRGCTAPCCTVLCCTVVCNSVRAPLLQLLSRQDFFILFLRAAKLHSAFGGGSSMTLLLAGAWPPRQSTFVPNSLCASVAAAAAVPSGISPSCSCVRPSSTPRLVGAA
jgi:hypothetical protein